MNESNRINDEKPLKSCARSSDTDCRRHPCKDVQARPLSIDRRALAPTQWSRYACSCWQGYRTARRRAQPSPGVPLDRSGCLADRSRSKPGYAAWECPIVHVSDTTQGPSLLGRRSRGSFGRARSCSISPSRLLCPRFVEVFWANSLGISTDL